MSKIGEVYVEIGLRAEKLASDLKKTEDLSKGTAKNIESTFDNIKLDKGIELTASEIDKIFKKLSASAGNTLKTWNKDFHDMADMKGSSARWAEYKRSIVEASDAINQVSQAQRQMAETTRPGVMVELRAEKLASDLKKIEDLSKETAKKFESSFKNIRLDFDNRLMVTKFNDLEKLHKKLSTILERKINVNADVASLERTRIQLDSIEKAMARYGSTSSRASGATNSLMETQRRGAMVGLSFNRIIQDAGWFGNSMAMGFMAVGNNITYFAEQMSFAKKEGLSMMGVLKGMLTGTNLWMFAINLAVSALTFFAVKQHGTQQESEGAGKSLKDLANKYKTLAEKIRDVKDEVQTLDFKDWAAGYRYVSGEVIRLTKDLDELVKKQKMYDEIKTGKSLMAGLSYPNVGALLFAPSKDEKKSLENEIKKKQAQLKEFQELFLLLEFAQAGFAQGSMDSFKRFSDKDLEFVSKTFRDFSREIAPETTKSFGALGVAIQTTKEEALGIANAIDKILKPKEKDTFSKEKSILEEYYKVVRGNIENEIKLKEQEIDRSYNLLSESAKKTVDLEKWKQEEIKKIRQSYEKELEDELKKSDAYKRSEMILEIGKSREKEKKESFTQNQKKYIFGEGLDQKGDKRESTPFQRMLQSVDDDLKEAENDGARFARLISGGFGDAIMAGKNFGDVLENIIAQLAGAVLQAGLFAAIMSVFTGGGSFWGLFTKNLGFGHSGGDFLGTSNGVMKLAAGGSFMVPSGYPNDSFPLMVETGERVSVTSASQTSFNDRAIVSELQSLRSEIGSLRSSGGNYVSKLYLDGKQITESVIRGRNQLNRGNIRVSR